PRQEREEIAAPQAVAPGQRLGLDALIEGDDGEPQVGQVPEAWPVAGLEGRADGADQAVVGEPPQAAVDARPAAQPGQPPDDLLAQQRQRRQEQQGAAVGRPLLERLGGCFDVAPVSSVGRVDRHARDSSSVFGSSPSSSPTGGPAVGGSVGCAEASKSDAWCGSAFPGFGFRCSRWSLRPHLAWCAPPSVAFGASRATPAPPCPGWQAATSARWLKSMRASADWRSRSTAAAARP